MGQYDCGIKRFNILFVLSFLKMHYAAPTLMVIIFVFISFLQDSSKYSAEIVTSPSLDVFLPEDEDNPYESVTTAVTRKPCSLDISQRLNACTGNGRKRIMRLKKKWKCVNSVKRTVLNGCHRVHRIVAESSTGLGQKC